MLQVKTYIAPDQYGGNGLFADEDIPKGGLILKFCFEYTRYIPVQEFYSMDRKEQEFLETYSYPHFEPEANPPLIGIMLNLDNARYSNHSDNPNAGLHPDDDNLCIALRDIKKGEQITCNYREFDPLDIIQKIGISTGKSFLLNQLSELNRLCG